MVGFLDLPLELREPILFDVVLDTTQPRPEDLNSLEHDPSYRRTTEDDYSDVGPGSIFCRPLQHHALPLLHVNQQIRAEVISLVSRRLGQRIDDAKVDVVYADGLSWNTPALYATWLSAFPINHLNTAHAQIRHVQLNSFVEIYCPHQMSNPSQNCHSWVLPQSAAMLLNFLAQTVSMQDGNASIHGPRSIVDANEHQKSDRKIFNLVIDIPFEHDKQDSLKARVRCSRCITGTFEWPTIHTYSMIPSGKRAALLFAQSLHIQLQRVFAMALEHCHASSTTSIIFERIGTIDVKVQGKLFGSFDLSQILANLPRSENWIQGYPSRADFFEWKRAAEKKRKTAGFKVVKHSIQEHELAGASGLIASILAARDEALVQKIPTLPDDTMPSTSQPAGDEVVAFAGDAVFVQDDGIKLPGHATFFSSELIWRYRIDPSTLPDVDPRDLELKEPLEYGELVLFKGEAVLFQSDKHDFKITSGNATFYGRAENGSTE